MNKDEEFRRMLYEEVSGKKASLDEEEFNAQCKELSDLLGVHVKQVQESKE
ncbi:MAG: hypothetical protein J5725_04390 [Bacteroidales bacterium]|nr:hypothetical protein [Bacteroidales bacterium]